MIPSGSGNVSAQAVSAGQIVSLGTPRRSGISVKRAIGSGFVVETTTDLGRIFV